MRTPALYGRAKVDPGDKVICAEPDCLTECIVDHAVRAGLPAIGVKKLDPKQPL
jgi:hypothetical protein